ncbi:hypothetical protein PCC7418_2424 [Halothece sp. PCC 7418]|nr:hypothetical protein [Halothece sp. PCC 7418]AFZ44571.1 hypothetical protein PCC7418_2424 [Halothece sp. PCC 7418]
MIGDSRLYFAEDFLKNLLISNHPVFGKFSGDEIKLCSVELNWTQDQETS